MLTEAERRELVFLSWLYRYYLDCWLATMNALDTIRPSVERIHDREVEVLARLKADEIDVDEARHMTLATLRDWLLEYREMTKLLNPVSLN